MSTTTSHADLLLSLNPRQREAVEHPPNVPLQILAGPGSGKTKVLTTRIAHLITHHDIRPSSICAVTFTNKAASEMRERLTHLLGKEHTSQIRMGTFHALCAMFLRKHAHVVGIEPNFTVCDAEESKKLIGKLIKPYSAYLADRDLTLKEGSALAAISKAKAKGLSPEAMMRESEQTTDDVPRIIAQIYAAYQTGLRASNSLDFDDLLVLGAELFAWNDGRIVRWCKHVLVDEFQDTNTIQYRLMAHLAAAHGCVTVVGDPDQSIYAWRSAEVANIATMRTDFTGTRQILLEQNYRSTGGVLALSLAIVTQDQSRIPKSLHTAHPRGTLPVLQRFDNERAEGQAIAQEIIRLIASMGGTLSYGDFAILLRFSALSRALESALQTRGIPHRVLGGHRFFERLEVKDLLAYLQLVDNARYAPAFVRVVNVPGRGVGEKTVNELLARAHKLKLAPLELVERICDGKTPDVKPPVRAKLKSFVGAMRKLRELATQGTSPADLLRTLLDVVGYEAHLRRTQQDFDSRWENVEELINFAAEAPTEPDGTSLAAEGGTPQTEGANEGDVTPLRAFLQTSMLSTDVDTQDDEHSKDKVTITTCHAAKGLEWPVVMIPAVEKGTFPFYRSEDIEEERRLLYVGCTRAQSFLYLSQSAQRMVGGESKKRELSEFVAGLAKESVRPALLASQPPRLSRSDRLHVSQVLGRPTPDEADVTRRLREIGIDVEEEAPAVQWSGVFCPPPSTVSSQPAPTFTTVRAPAAPNPPPPRRAPPLLKARPPAVNGASGMPSKPHTATPNIPGKASLASYAPVPVTETLPPAPTPTGEAALSIVPGKRRLGMGRGGTGYTNKKFKLSAPPA